MQCPPGGGDEHMSVTPLGEGGCAFAAKHSALLFGINNYIQSRADSLVLISNMIQCYSKSRSLIYVIWTNPQTLLNLAIFE